MLVLSRKKSQRIKIGDNIVVSVLKLKGDQVRIGIEAPQEVRILREELDERPPGADAPTPAPVAA